MANPVFAEVGGNAVQYYVAITITNSQSSATPAPFQQMITVNSNNYSSYLASNLSNVNFQDGNGNILSSWLESGNSNTSTSTIYWVSLPNGIAANSSITIYYCIYATSVNAFNNTNTGVAPQLTSTYAQYDDGANVFSNYWNFAGTSLPSNLVAIDLEGGSGSYTQNNGISFDSSGSGGYGAVSNFALSGNYFVDTLGYTTSAGGGGGARPLLVFSASADTSNPEEVGLDQGGFGVNAWDVFGYTGGTSGSYTNYGSFGSTLNADQYFQMSVGVSGSSDLIAAYPQGSTTPYTYSSYTTTNYGGYIGIGTEKTSSGITFYWLRTRAYPPNGTMPSTSFGSLTQATISVTITYSSEAETYAIPTQVNTPLSYSESESESMSQTLTAGSLLITEQYSETETYTTSQYINAPIISYAQNENYIEEAQADLVLSYSETETYTTSLVYGVAPIVYSDAGWYSLLANNTLANASGQLVNNLYAVIPPNLAKAPTSIAQYMISSKYLPPETNVNSVQASDYLPVNLSFNFNITASANTSTYVVTATVTDTAGNAIPNVVITWTASGGTVSPTTSTTNASGQATTTASGASVTVTASATILGVTNTASATT